MANIIEDKDWLYVQFTEDEAIDHSVEWTPSIIVDVTEDHKVVGIQLMLPKEQVEEAEGVEEEVAEVQTEKVLRLVEV